MADPGYFKALDIKKGSYARRAFHNVAVSGIDFWHHDEKAHPGFAQVRWLHVEVPAGCGLANNSATIRATPTPSIAFETLVS